VQPTPPFWFKQRQGKVEAVEGNIYRLTAPNLSEAFIGVEPAGGLYRAVLRPTREGPDLAVGKAWKRPEDAWEEAFELYRTWLVV
jgi:hypothetical protein